MNQNLKSTLIQTYDKIVKEYVEHEFDNPQMNKHYTMFLSLVPKKSKILDVGCGPGQASKRFSDAGHQVTGIDLSKEMIHFCKKKIPNAKFLVMDAEKISLTEKFDAIWAAFILVHIPLIKHQKVLNKFFQILKPGGIMYLGMLEGQGEKVMPEPYNRKYKQFFVFCQKKELIQRINRAGFQVLTYDTEEFNEKGTIFVLSHTFAKKPKATPQ